MTSILEYLQLLKQINNVPSEVKEVAVRDIEKIKKEKIYIPNATIRKSVTKFRQQYKIERYDENEEYYGDKTGTNQKKANFQERESFNKRNDRKYNERYSSSDEEIFI